MYNELVNSIKVCVCVPCEKEKNVNCLARNEEDCRRELMAQAADAITELQGRIERAINLYNRNVEKTAMYEVLEGISPEPPKEATDGE